MTAYRGRIAQTFTGDSYSLFLTDTFTKTIPSGLSITDDFEIERNSVELNWYGSDGDIFTTLMTSSLSWTFIAEDSGQETELNDIIGDNTTTWYALLFKSTTLYWWGYANAETGSINREYKPRYRFEAFDKLTLAGMQKIWDYVPTGVNAPYNTLFGIGWRKNVDPSTTNQIPAFGWEQHPLFNRNSSLLGIVYGCLFDTDQVNTGKQDLNVVQWDVDKDTDTPGFTRSIENWSYSAVDQCFFKDFRSLSSRGQWIYTRSDKRDWKIADILHDVALTHRARILQRNGEYYFIQWEAYQGDTASGNMRIHQYDNSQLTPAASIPGFVLMPRHSVSSSLSSSQYKVSLAVPRTDPEIEPGTNTTLLQAMDKVLLSIKNEPNSDEYAVLERGVDYTNFTSSPFNNWSEASRNKEERQINWPLTPWKKLIYDGSGNLKNIKYTVRRWDGSAFQNKHLHEHLVDVMAEYRNGIKRVLNVTLRGTYDPIQALTIDSRTYLPTTINMNLETAQTRISAVEFSRSSTGLSELKKNADVIQNPGGGLGSGVSGVEPKLTSNPGGGISGI